MTILHSRTGPLSSIFWGPWAFWRDMSWIQNDFLTKIRCSAMVLVTWLAKESYTICTKFSRKLSYFLTNLGYFGLKSKELMSGVECSQFRRSKWPLSGLFSMVYGWWFSQGCLIQGCLCDREIANSPAMFQDVTQSTKTKEEETRKALFHSNTQRYEEASPICIKRSEG